MTLEHIADPCAFLNTIALHSKITSDLVILVPAQERIFAQAAFWDIYYEHCNYFSQQSLALAVTKAGYEIASIESCFSEQYLMLIAHKSISAIDSASQIQIEHNLRHQVDAKTIAKKLQTAIEDYGSRLKGQSILIWGAASKAVGLLHAIPELQARVSLVDINPNKWGSYLPGTELKIHEPKDLSGSRFQQILIANSIYSDEILQTLSTLDIRGEIIALD